MAETERQLQLVTFQIGEERYGIDIMRVKEIQKVQDIRTIPNAPSFVEGIINLRGDIIPVINLHKRFHIKRLALTEEDKLLSGFLILDLQGMQIGVFIQPPPQMISGIGAEYIQGVVKEEEGYLIILDILRLFDPKELQQISRLGK